MTKYERVEIGLEQGSEDDTFSIAAEAGQGESARATQIGFREDAEGDLPVEVVAENSDGEEAFGISSGGPSDGGISIIT